MKIAITGSSGHIGGMVARHLSARGLPLILPLRNPAKAPDLPACEARLFAYGDFELARQALSGVDVLFMVSAAESPTREQEHLALVRAAAAAGVQHLVYLSFAGASASSTFTLARTHAATEAAIQQTAMRYTFLRDNFYSEMMATIANADGIIAGTAGRSASGGQHPRRHRLRRRPPPQPQLHPHRQRSANFRRHRRRSDRHHRQTAPLPQPNP